MTLGSLQSEVNRFLSTELVERMKAPLGAATCLPNAAYTSKTFFELEQRLIFRRGWVIAGYTHQLDAPGAIIPVDVAGIPLLLVRDEHGEIRVFQNVCRHRGARLINVPCKNRQSIICPYHAWSYALNGTLQRRPHFNGGDLHDVIEGGSEEKGLFVVRSVVWNFWIMVNIDGNAPPLSEYLAPVEKHLRGYDFSAAVYAGELEFSIATNWKFACENYIEPYHVFSAHPRLSAFVPMRDRKPSVSEKHIMWNYYQFQSAEEGRGLGLPHFPNLTPALSQRGIWFLVFPTIAFEVYPDHIALFHVNPISPNRTVEKIVIYLVGEAATATQYQTGRQAVLDMWKNLNEEDIDLLLALQRGRAAPAYDGGLLSPYWDEAPRNFSRLVAKTMLKQSRLTESA